MRETPARELDKIIIRLPDGMREALTTRAQLHGRSVNAEVVDILSQQLAPSVAGRLQYLLSEVNSARGLRKISASKLAELIGDESEHLISEAVAGRRIPTFNELDRIADIFGCSRDWLRHGEGNAFEPLRYHGLSATNFRDFERQYNPIKWVFIRNNSNYGEFAAVLQLTEFKFVVVTTTIHLSSHTGAGGDADNASLSNAFRWIWQKHKGSSFGYLCDEKLFDELTSGAHYPAAALTNLKSSHWIDDWWDPIQFRKLPPDSYWMGFKSFCERVYSHVQTDTRLKAERIAIEEGRSGSSRK